MNRDIFYKVLPNLTRETVVRIHRLKSIREYDCYKVLLIKKYIRKVNTIEVIRLKKLIMMTFNIRRIDLLLIILDLLPSYKLLSLSYYFLHTDAHSLICSYLRKDNINLSVKYRIDLFLYQHELYEKYEFFEIQNIKRIETPELFYKTIIELLRKSKNVYLSSMYLGTEEKSIEILKILSERVRKNRRTIILLDGNRGIDDDIERLLERYKIRKIVQFIQSSSTLIPKKIREVLKVFHTKVMIFDDNILLTGANLDDSYFTNRFDRYFVISNRELSRFLITSIFKLNDKNTCEISKKRSNSKIIYFNNIEEEKFIRNILEEEYEEIYISTAYLNFSKKYIELFKDRRINLIVNSPETNKFTKMGVLCNIIRQCYSYSSYCTLKELKYLNLYEFRKEGYTMHNKGIWVFNNSKVTTIIGSSNFNRRSVERDIEGNFMISTKDKDHISLFKDEIDFLISNSKLIERNDMLKRKFSLLIILFFFILNKFF